MHKLIKVIIIAIISLFICLPLTCKAESLFEKQYKKSSGNISAKLASKLVDFTSIPNTYKFYEATYMYGTYHIAFVNPHTGYCITFILSKYANAKSDYDYKVHVLQGLDRVLRGEKERRKGVQFQTTAVKKFTGHNQVIYYYLADKYMDGNYIGKMITGNINNYKGKSIVVQGWSVGTKFNEQEALNIFRNARFFPENL